MKLGLVTNAFGEKLQIDLKLIHHAERLGFDSVWTAEAIGSDAVTTATWIAAKTERIKVGTAIMQMPARTPAMTAMTAMSLDQLSGGRFILGLGAAGPLVVESWHGLPYGKPLTRTREYVQILRKILARDAPVAHQGFHYQVPRLGEGTTGLGQPLQCMLEARPHLKIYTASVGPRGLRCSGEVANGVLPAMVKPERVGDLLLPHLEEGFAAAGGGKGLEDFAICPSVNVTISDDLEKARLPIKMRIAFYVGGGGGWGPQSGKNLFNDNVRRLGYEEAAIRVQEFYRSGKRMEAAAAVPDALIDDVDLIGPVERIRERLDAWREAGRKHHVDTLVLETSQPEALELLAEELL